MTTNRGDALNARLSYVRSAINAAQWKDAGIACQQILAEHPEHAEARYCLAFVYQNSGQPERAIEAYRWLTARHGANADLLNNLGIVYESVQKTEDALDCYRQATGHDASHVSSLYNLGRLLRTTGKPADAVAHLTAARKMAGGSGEVLLELGLAYKALGDNDAAADYLQQARKIDPSNPAILNSLGNTWQARGDLSEAIACYKAALELKPDFADVYNNLGAAWLARGNVQEALKNYEMAARIRPDWLGARSNILLARNYLSDDPAALYSDHLRQALPPQGRAGTASICSPHPAGKPTRIGYISPDFRMHSVAYFFATLLRNHDKTRFEAVCFADVAREDSMTRELQSLASNWHNIFGKSDDHVYQLVRDQNIDILVDLAGHTANNRLALFAMQAAPVQLSYLGYPNTTGLAAIQYRITDHWADPEGPADTLHSEKLVRLDRGFLCYTPVPESPPVTDLPAQTAGHVTFGSFNVLAKISDPCVEVWSTILHQVPDARLLLKSAGLQDTATREYILQRFAQRGIESSRIDLVARTRDFQSHMQLYQTVDIALDTFPYNGTTTTCEALWMGVPVITLAGNRHASRVGCSLLNQVGLKDMIADSANDYIAAASNLARDLERLGRIRHALRSDMSSSALCDGPGLARAFEAACQRMILFSKR